MRINREAWSSEEDAILREKALAERAVVEIARVVGRTESAVRSRAFILRVALRPRRLD